MAESILPGVRPETALTWTVHLARREPRRAVVALLAVAVTSAAAYAVWMHPAAPAIFGALVLAAVGEFLLPVTYRVGPDGVWCRNLLSLRHLEWKDVRRCYRDDGGIKLSPLSSPSRLDAYRGIYLWLDHQGPLVADTIRDYLRRETTA